MCSMYQLWQAICTIIVKAIHLLYIILQSIVHKPSWSLADSLVDLPLVGHGLS